ncbi:MAG: hypothetical protein LBU80_02245 [Rikenellaceae bacterium]|jgi:hypothetical protein|nr:hypothetical protein [Rikenellaceae bacterium]
MKNKKTTYLLLLVALAVWALVFRWVVAYTAPEATSVLAGSPKSESRTSKRFDAALRLDYRDPFLDESPPQDTLFEDTWSPEVIAPEELPPPEAPPPLSVQLQGTIRKGTRLYAVLAGGGPSELLSKDDSVAGYRITTIASDSIVLQQGKYRHTLKLQ